MKLLVAAGLAALIEAGAVTAMAAAPLTPPSPPAQSTIQQSDTCRWGRVHRGRWRHRGMIFRRRQWRCRRGRCRWYYW
jgi:hypothetical protein